MDNNKHIIISVGRQLGSGGHAVAKLLASAFDAKLYDKELLNIAARESGFSAKFFERNDERNGFLKSLSNVGSAFGMNTCFYDNKFSQDGLFKFQSDAIRRAAEAQSSVFVGRCADYVLRDMPNMVSVFITADKEERTLQVSQRNGCSQEAAWKLICEEESKRSSYYNYYTGKRWGYSASYDLCVNTSRLGIDGSAAHIQRFIEAWMEKRKL